MCTFAAIFPISLSSNMVDSYRHKGMRKKLVDSIRRKGITDENVLDALNTVPRHQFLDSSFLEYAYDDTRPQNELYEYPYYIAAQQQWVNRIVQVLRDAQHRGEMRQTVDPDFFLLVQDKLTEMFKDPAVKKIYPTYNEFFRAQWNFLIYGIIMPRSPGAC